MAHWSIEEACRALEQSLYAKLGPFKFIETAKVSNRKHKKHGSIAHYFTGKYHRHALYVFSDGKIVFLNEEDDDLLW